jgi:hypothetical protein
MWIGFNWIGIRRSEGLSETRGWIRFYVERKELLV